ncbi:MAG: hypothetical protein KKD07_10760, partial [Candidatus Omnitrophica bacterium]|nr:hypothetical protein [Candidatus Omnitrophota bacterium]
LVLSFLILALGGGNAYAVTEFVSVIDPDSGAGFDYVSLQAWEAAIDSNLTVATTLVIAGSLTRGSIADGTAITQTITGATAVCLHHTSTQMMIITLVGTQNATDTWYPTADGDDTTNVWTPTDAGDSVIAVAKCRSTGGTADTLGVTINGWTTSAANYIKIWTDPSEGYRHNGVWDDTKYQIYRNVTAARQPCLTISEGNVKIIGLQFRNSTTAYDNDSGIVDITSSSNGPVWIANNIIRGNNDNFWYDQGIVADNNTDNIYIYNNLIYDVGDDNGVQGGIRLNPSGMGVNCYVYNNTIVNSYAGIVQQDGTVVAINNIVKGSGNTNTYIGTFNGASDYNATNSTDTDDGGSNSLQVANLTFSGASDFHLASDSDAINAGLGTTPKALFTDDIDGDERPGVDADWDIGADEYVSSGAVVFEDDATGNWSAGATWGNAGSSEGVDYPGAGDVVTIDGGTVTLTADASIGDITIDGGQLSFGSYTLNVDGDWTYTSGTVDFSTGSVNFNGASGTKIITSGSQTFYNFTINSPVSGATYQPADNMDINGDFVLVNGTLDLNTNDVDVKVAGDFTLTGGTFTKGAGTLNFDGNLTYTDSIGSTNVGNLVIGGSPEVTDMATDLVADTLTVNYSDTLNTHGYDLDIGGIIDINGTLDTTDDVEGDGTTIEAGGSWDMTGATFTIANSSVTFDSSASGNTITSDSKSFYDVLFNNAGGDWALSDDMVVDNSLTVTSGEFQGGSYDLTVSANWTMGSSGTFTAGTSSVEFDDSSKTSVIYGLTAFNNLLVRTASKRVDFEAGTTTTVSNAFTIDGQATGTKVDLNSTSVGTQWTINTPIANADVNFADVIDSKSTNRAISATNSTDSGNNENWGFPIIQIYRSVGPSATAPLDDDNTNADTITISGGVATFSAAVANNVGVGDVILYDSSNNNALSNADSIAFIKSRTDSTHYVLQTENGATPADLPANDTWEIYRAYTSLSNAEAGTVNSTLDALSISYTGGNRDLVANYEQWNIACYADAVDSASDMNISGWNTSAQNYIRFY